jgi:drug/metabolite transporter (DMT)-like permease
MSASLPRFSSRQLVLLVLLTIVWGLNWPIMKVGVAHFPPLTFRMIAMWLAVPVLALVLWQQKAPWTVPRAAWGKLALLTLTNMLMWHCLMILSMPLLSSGRAAILGYTMPIFSAVIGVVVFGEHLAGRAWAGVAAAALGVVLLLWHAVASLGSPLGVALILTAAAGWAMGTQLLRRTDMPVPLMTLSFWMVLLTAIFLTLLSTLFERQLWHWPDHTALVTILYNGPLAIGFAQVTWFFLARTLPPVASTLSVMLIPVIGVFTGAWWLGEQLRWQDWAAVALIMLAIASVLWPKKVTP